MIMFVVHLRHAYIALRIRGLLGDSYFCIFLFYFVFILFSFFYAIEILSIIQSPHISCKGSSSGDLGSVEYPLIVIIPRSTTRIPFQTKLSSVLCIRKNFK